MGNGTKMPIRNFVLEKNNFIQETLRYKEVALVMAGGHRQEMLGQHYSLCALQASTLARCSKVDAPGARLWLGWPQAAPVYCSQIKAH